MRISWIFLVYFVFALTAAGQDAPSPARVDWNTFVTKKGDLTVSLPGQPLVHVKERLTTLYYGDGGISCRLEFSPPLDLRSRLEIRPSRFDWTKDAEESHFTMGDFAVHMYTGGTSISGVYVELYSPQGSYSIELLAKNANDPMVMGVLKSVLLGDKPLMKDGRDSTQNYGVPTLVSELKTSQQIKDFEKHKQSAKIEIENSPEPVEVKKREEEFVSTPVIFLVTPFPKHADLSGFLSSGGGAHVRLRLLLKANGDIGKITVVSRSREGAEKRFIEAAKQAKFFPAMLDGKFVDSSKEFDYTSFSF